MLPAFQRRVVGKSLISVGHQIPAKMGFAISVVLGDPAYYMNSGSIPAIKCGIYPPFNIDSKYYMVHPLGDGELPNGIVILIRHLGFEKKGHCVSLPVSD